IGGVIPSGHENEFIIFVAGVEFGQVNTQRNNNEFCISRIRLDLNHEIIRVCKSNRNFLETTRLYSPQGESVYWSNRAKVSVQRPVEVVVCMEEGNAG